ncbi:hypothetical protein FQN57_001408 [Myotisia sp. PD_48]|nr:hypothetical protein FQN57_001408 [Myotisia sp. PD_48]
MPTSNKTKFSLFNKRTGGNQLSSSANSIASSASSLSSISAIKARFHRNVHPTSGPDSHAMPSNTKPNKFSSKGTSTETTAAARAMYFSMK